jgi:uncharacterized protein (DUF2141 family)
MTRKHDNGSVFAAIGVEKNGYSGLRALKALRSATVAVAAFATIDPAWAADVSVVVAGAEPNGAKVFVAICANDFNAASCPFGASKVPQGPTVKFDFTGVTPSRYAIVAFQDTDGTGTLRRSKLGIPLEPFALSNDAGRTAKPTFEAAAVTIGGGGGEFRLNLRTIIHHSNP